MNFTGSQHYLKKLAQGLLAVYIFVVSSAVPRANGRTAEKRREKKIIAGARGIFEVKKKKSFAEIIKQNKNHRRLLSVS